MEKIIFTRNNETKTFDPEFSSWGTVFGPINLLFHKLIRSTILLILIDVFIRWLAASVGFGFAFELILLCAVNGFTIPKLMIWELRKNNWVESISEDDIKNS